MVPGANCLRAVLLSPTAPSTHLHSFIFIRECFNGILFPVFWFRRQLTISKRFWIGRALGSLRSAVCTISVRRGEGLKWQEKQDDDYRFEASAASCRFLANSLRRSEDFFSLILSRFAVRLLVISLKTVSSKRVVRLGIILWRRVGLKEEDWGIFKAPKQTTHRCVAA